MKLSTHVGHGLGLDVLPSCQVIPFRFQKAPGDLEFNSSARAGPFVLFGVLLSDRLVRPQESAFDFKRRDDPEKKRQEEETTVFGGPGRAPSGEEERNRNKNRFMRFLTATSRKRLGSLVSIHSCYRQLCRWLMMVVVIEMLRDVTAVTLKNLVCTLNLQLSAYPGL